MKTCDINIGNGVPVKAFLNMQNIAQCSRLFCSFRYWHDVSKMSCD